MRFFTIATALILLAASLAAEQTPPAARQYTGGPVVELDGEITRVQAVKGQGMPYLEIEAGGVTHKVHLGSMRYLLQQDFSPSVGEKIEVEGFRRGDDEILAKSVKLVRQNKTLNLRDDNGRPLWQRGRYGQQQSRGRLETEGKQ